MEIARVDVCPVCGTTGLVRHWRGTSTATESGVDPKAFQPSSDRFGRTVGQVVVCQKCGHGTVASLPESAMVSRAYVHAADPVSLREEAGQVETARRALVRIEQWVPPGRLLDVGCWTGSFLAAARDRGWETSGLEPSRWASERARDRGLTVSGIELDEAQLDDNFYDVVVACDILEHLAHPVAATKRFHAALRGGGVLYITVPDAGSRLARVLGSHWWSVLPMHLQYFTRSSLTRLLNECGFDVLEIRTHAKMFTIRYYAERFGAFVPGVGGAAAWIVGRTPVADRLAAPDFRDRMAVIALAR